MPIKCHEVLLWDLVNIENINIFKNDSKKSIVIQNKSNIILIYFDGMCVMCIIQCRMYNNSIMYNTYLCSHDFNIASFWFYHSFIDYLDIDFAKQWLDRC